MRRMILALLVGASLAGPAFANDADHGLHLQLGSEMKTLAARNAWSGVDANYRKLLELEARGEHLSSEEHRLGAEAARALGDMAACRERLGRALAVGRDESASSMMADIDANYGAVTLEVEGKHEPKLTPETPPFAPDQRTAIAYANQQLGRDQRFEGLLPAGLYHVAGGDLTVTAGGTLSASLTPTGVRMAGEEKTTAKVERPDRPVGLVVATGAAAVASGVCYGLALNSKGNVLDPTTPYGDLTGLRTTTNLLGGIAVGGALATVGLGVGVALAW